VTGSGKSTFIANATGQQVKIGHEYESCTEEVELFQTEIDGRRVFFIDTPGFDDSSGRDDADILELTAEKLREISESNLYLTSVLFLHKITDNRLTGSSKRLQRVYKEVCGPESYGSVVLGTTMWDDLKRESDGIKREKQLIEGDYWGKLINRGTGCHRLRNSKDSALKLAQILAAKQPVLLKMQQELEEYKGRLAWTSAAIELLNIFAERIEKQERRAKLDKSERAELERLKAGEGKVKERIVPVKRDWRSCIIM